MTKVLVEVKNLVVQFGSFKAVNNISFSASPGEIFGFLGANGAGKTTTLRVLTGLLIPSAGSVQVAGIPLNESTAIQIKSRIGYMSQKFTLYNDLSVVENLNFTAALRKIPPELARLRQEQLLKFIRFQPPVSTLVRDLPPGMKQQVALANALLHDPDLVFLDEPTAGVSPEARQQFWDLIHELGRRGKTLFVSSHYMEEMEQCHRIALMRSGEVIALDSPAGLKASAFPGKVYELQSRDPRVDRRGLAAWKEQGTFDLYEPYGTRYHVTVKNQTLWQQFQSQQSSHWNVREIAASLEDVFIHLVEGPGS